MAVHPIPLSQLNLETVKTPDETIVHCSGRITSSTSEQLQTTVRSLIPNTKCVVLDLTNVSYMDSSGLGALVGLYVSGKRQYCGLKLVNVNQRLRELFHLTKLDSVFEGHDEFSPHS